MPQPRYKRASGAVYNLHLHFVWCPKYGRKVLVGEIETRLRQLIAEKANDLAVDVEGLEVRPDYVHLFLAVPPTDAPQFYANQLKGYTSRVLRQEFPALRSRMPSLWSRSYYVGSAGHVSTRVIQDYIARQKERG